MPNQGHKAQQMYDGLMQFLTDNDLDIKNCRGQSYDNASAMSGKYNGLQAKVMQQNNLASWIPCAGHSLNLVGKAAAECCQAATEFFLFVENIYVFFTASTHRFQILTDFLSQSKLDPQSQSELDNESTSAIHVPKRCNATRWASKADATKALVQGYKYIGRALIKIANDQEQLAVVRCKARGLHERMELLETGIYAVFWNEILDRVNATSKVLQSSSLYLNTAVTAVKSLIGFVESKRECFSHYEQLGADLSGVTEYERVRNRKHNVRLNPLDYSQAPESKLSAADKFRVTNFLPVIDQFVAELNKRLSSYEVICSRFGFLAKLDSCSPDDIHQAARKLVDIYTDDLEDSLASELVQFSYFVKTLKDDKSEDISFEQFMYQLIIDKQLKASFPNVEIVLRMYLVLMVTNCSAERSFSKLKIIKNRLRTTMADERLSHLALMSIEHDILSEIDFEDLIKEFAARKTRKVHI